MMPFRAILTVTTFVLVASVSTAAGATVVGDWNAAALAEIRAAVPKVMGPPMAARALAIVHTCMYDAWAAYDRVAVGTVLGDRLRRPDFEHTDANKAKAISFAAHRCLVNLFADPALFPPPANPAEAVALVVTRLNEVLTSHGYRVKETSTTKISTPAGVGNLAAQAVIDFRRNDGSNQYGTVPGSSGVAYSDYTGYVPRNEPMGFCTPLMDICPPIEVADPNHWQPLIGPPPQSSTQKFIGCQWENVTPFALTSANQFDHLRHTEPDIFKNPGHYRKAAEEVLHNSAALDAERKLIVEYWADGPASELPPGHWGLFAQSVSQRDNHPIDQDVKMFFAMHNASFDAGIVAWHLKRLHDGVRPITAIRYLMQGTMIRAFGGPGQPIEVIPGEKWMPYNPGSNLTPAFAGYISGHSAFSAASAAVLRAFTDSDYFGFSTIVPAGFGRVEPGIPEVDTIISYETFSDAANAAALSRLYGGIHFSEDNTTGLALGTLIGRQAWEKAQSYFHGGE